MWTGDDLKPISMWDYVLFRLARIFPERSLHLTFSYLSSDVMLKETKQWDKNVKNLQELRDSSVDVTIPREKWCHQSTGSIQASSEGLKLIKCQTQGPRYDLFLWQWTQPLNLLRILLPLEQRWRRVIKALLCRN